MKIKRTKTCVTVLNKKSCQEHFSMCSPFNLRGVQAAKKMMNEFFITQAKENFHSCEKMQVKTSKKTVCTQVVNTFTSSNKRNINLTRKHLIKKCYTALW